MGWLFLPVQDDELQVDEIWQALRLGDTVDRVKPRLVLVDDHRFDLVVNSNLEVRTSVAIDPATGAAEEGALYTYEAIPRGSVMTFGVTYNNPSHFRFPKLEDGTIMPTSMGVDTQWVEDQIVSGLDLMEYLGVGGMNTRGFGRIKIWKLTQGEAQ
jgi:CRISPR-associated protein Cmr4